MRLDGNESDNVQDVRGSSGGLPIGGSLGVGAIVVALIGSYVFGIDPGVILGLLEGGNTSVQTPARESGQPPAHPTDEKAVFVSKVLKSTEDTWT
ncbi:MAG: neutral zinc metallopeptidase, partial [Burkholderiales bacterium]